MRRGISGKDRSKSRKAEEGTLSAASHRSIERLGEQRDVRSSREPSLSSGSQLAALRSQALLNRIREMFRRTRPGKNRFTMLFHQRICSSLTPCAVSTSTSLHAAKDLSDALRWMNSIIHWAADTPDIAATSRKRESAFNPAYTAL